MASYSGSFLRARRAGLTEEPRLVVQRFPEMNCPWEDEETGTRCNALLKKAHRTRLHLIKSHALGIFKTPYVCEPCGKCHTEYKQRNNCKKKERHPKGPEIRPKEKEALLGLFVDLLDYIFPCRPTPERLAFVCEALQMLNARLGSIPASTGPTEAQCRQTRQELLTMLRPLQPQAGQAAPGGSQIPPIMGPPASANSWHIEHSQYSGLQEQNSTEQLQGHTPATTSSHSLPYNPTAPAMPDIYAFPVSMAPFEQSSFASEWPSSWHHNQGNM
ncbi:hypothetical protein FN846DRAFT_572752 [Sphaerosporella brunnea]|uniref:Uncharacterized protein n=1 Tax=Sphaerosporella brunnea TaxID=1250544 RepID=A0A5J5EDJ6_9PEZI|nr:hypothetical protein FN846DRAFT_572752 [Sphaerosporella brunnea]